MLTPGDAVYEGDEIETALLELNPGWSPLTREAKAAIAASVAATRPLTDSEARQLGRLLRRVVAGGA